MNAVDTLVQEFNSLDALEQKITKRIKYLEAIQHQNATPEEMTDLIEFVDYRDDIWARQNVIRSELDKTKIVRKHPLPAVPTLADIWPHTMRTTS
jgi:hypothetical protein